MDHFSLMLTQRHFQSWMVSDYSHMLLNYVLTCPRYLLDAPPSTWTGQLTALPVVVHVHCNVKINNEHYIVLGGPLQVPGSVHGCVQACVKASLQCDTVTCAMLRKCNTQIDIELIELLRRDTI